MIKSKVYKGVRDFGVRASIDSADQVTVAIKLGPYAAGGFHFDLKEWPTSGSSSLALFNQQAFVIKKMGAKPEDDQYCQEVRLADEAIKAIKEITEGGPECPSCVPTV
jgi:hypothetical protein